VRTHHTHLVCLHHCKARDADSDHAKCHRQLSVCNIDVLWPYVQSLFVSDSVGAARLFLLKNCYLISKVLHCQMYYILYSLSDDRLPYVEATILELFRYKTLVPMVVHCTLKDTEVGGYFVPKGTMVRRYVCMTLHPLARIRNVKMVAGVPMEKRAAKVP